MKTSVFSNGHTDLYQGNRDVTAGWMITETETGRVIGSGHSLTKEIAAKTAASSIPKVAWAPSGRTAYDLQTAWKAGFKSIPAMRDDARAKNAAHASLFKIEVVTL